MAADELHESDLIFPIDNTKPQTTPYHNQKKRKQQKTANSAPVSIPRNNKNAFRFGDPDEEEFEEDYEDDSEELVPPHVILGRRVGAGKMAFSVCTGNGRTLKGRDLSRVRNSILRMTGFLET